MKIRLTKRFAKFIDGIDLSRATAGEVLEVSSHEAALLILEGWAAPIDEVARRVTIPATRHEAKDRPRPSGKSARRSQRTPHKG